MKLLSIRTESFRGLADGTYVFGSAGSVPHFAAITGSRGAGKTTLLEAIIAAKESVSPYGAWESGPSFIRRGRAAATLEARWWLSDDERTLGETTEPVLSSKTEIAVNGSVEVENDVALTTVLGSYKLASSASKFEYFDADRRLDGMSAYLGDDADRGLRLSRDPRKYSAVIPFLARMAAAQDDTEGTPWRRFALAFATLCKDRMFLGTETLSGQERLVFSDLNGVGTTPMQLSGAQKQALIFAATSVRLRLEQSVVLIDSPELGLPCDEVVRFTTAVAELFPDGQVIVATASRELLSSLPSERVITLGGSRQ